MYLPDGMLRLSSDLALSSFLFADVLLFLAVSGGGPITFDPKAIWEESRGVGPLVMDALTPPVSSSKQMHKTITKA